MANVVEAVVYKRLRREDNSFLDADSSILTASFQGSQPHSNEVLSLSASTRCS
jgi:hypothetical protein